MSEFNNDDIIPKKPFRVGDGTPGPGRPKNSKNKRSLKKIEEVLLSNDIEPIEKLLTLIPSLDPKDQLNAWALIFKYTYAPPIQRSVDDNQTIQITYSKPPETV